MTGPENVDASIWPSQGIHAPITRIEQHGTIAEKAFQRPALPSRAGAPKHASDSGASVQQTGSGTNSMRYFVAVHHVAMQLDNQVEVFAHRSLGEAACCHDLCPAKHPERARHQHQRVDAAPREPAIRKARRYSTTWNSGSSFFGRRTSAIRRSRYASRLQSDGAADGDDSLRVVDERLHGPDQRIGFQNESPSMTHAWGSGSARAPNAGRSRAASPWPRGSPWPAAPTPRPRSSSPTRGPRRPGRPPRAGCRTGSRGG